MNYLKIFSFSTIFLSTSTGGVYLYKNYYPKTINDWLSFKKEETITDEKLFKAIFVEHKSDLQNKKIVEDGDDIDKGFPKLKSFCETTLNKEDFTKEDWRIFSKYCVSRPNLVTTVQAFLVKAGNKEFEKTIEDEKYKTIFAVYKYDSNFSSTLNKTSTTENEEGKNALKTWCSENLKKNAKSTNINKVKLYCSPLSYSTVHEKLKKEKGGWEKVDEGGWDDQFDTWKNTKDITSLLENANKDTPKTQGGPKLKAWCEEQLNKKLHEKDIYQDKYIKVKSVCKKTSGSQVT